MPKKLSTLSTIEFRSLAQLSETLIISLKVFLVLVWNFKLAMIHVRLTNSVENTQFI